MKRYCDGTVSQRRGEIYQEVQTLRHANTTRDRTQQRS